MKIQNSAFHFRRIWRWHRLNDTNPMFAFRKMAGFVCNSIYHLLNNLNIDRAKSSKWRNARIDWSGFFSVRSQLWRGIISLPRTNFHLFCQFRPKSICLGFVCCDRWQWVWCHKANYQLLVIARNEQRNFHRNINPPTDSNAKVSTDLKKGFQLCQSSLSKREANYALRSYRSIPKAILEKSSLLRYLIEIFRFEFRRVLTNKINQKINNFSRFSPMFRLTFSSRFRIVLLKNKVFPVASQLSYIMS